MESSATFRFPSLSLHESPSNIPVVDPVVSIVPLEPSDEVLLSQISRGDKNALTFLFRRYAAVIRNVAYRVLRDTCEAHDLAQDIFLLLHRDCKAFDRSKGSARFWILQMTYRRAISRRRYLSSRHFYTRVDLDDVADQLIDPRALPCQLDPIEGRFPTGPLQKMFAELSEDQRQTLNLFFVEGYTLDEIAAKLGQSRGNIKHHYFRGLERLRKQLFGSRVSGERAVS